MTEDDPRDMGIFKLRRRDFTRVRAGVGSETVLSTDLDGRVNGILDAEQVDGGWAYDDLYTKACRRKRNTER